MPQEETKNAEVKTETKKPATPFFQRRWVKNTLECGKYVVGAAVGVVGTVITVKLSGE